MDIVFAGDQVLSVGDGLSLAPSDGLIFSRSRFRGGRISATIDFDDFDEVSACHVVVAFDAASGTMIAAGPGGYHRQVPDALLQEGAAPPAGRPATYSIRQGDGFAPWTVLASSGNPPLSMGARRFEVSVERSRSGVVVRSGEGELLAVELPSKVPKGRLGFWFRTRTRIRVSDLVVSTAPCKALVIMEYSAHYNQLYNEVIKDVCPEFELEVVRLDERYDPGSVPSQLEEEIADTDFVIADLTPSNLNVYYELGFAHGMKKPAILLADRATSVPFDIRHHRVLRYESASDTESIVKMLRESLRSVISKLP